MNSLKFLPNAKSEIRRWFLTNHSNKEYFIGISQRHTCKIQCYFLYFADLTETVENNKLKATTAWKVSKYGVFSGPYFPAFGLNTERYFVSLRIQSEWGKIRTIKNSAFGQFSRSELFHQSTKAQNHRSCYLYFIFGQIENIF